MSSMRRAIGFVACACAIAAACSSFTSSSDETVDAGSPSPPPVAPPSDAGADAIPDADAGGSYRDLVLGEGPLAYWRLGQSVGGQFADETGHGYALTFAD